jgi:hypothetical protein
MAATLVPEFLQQLIPAAAVVELRLLQPVLQVAMAGQV